MTQHPPIAQDPLNAFCRETIAFLEGAFTGPLAGVSFAAKDIFDVAGHVTGGGNPDWKATHKPAIETAWAVRTLVEAGATMVGKTLTDELTRGIFGENPHYGTPTNPRAPGRVPGGSSCGSAAAVAGELVDFALGSDTGGSVRVPASFCGLYGLRPTHGRISLHGLMLQAPGYDTIGWFARDMDMFARVGEVLLQTSVPTHRPAHLVVAQDAFDLADSSTSEALRPYVDQLAALVGDSKTEILAESGLAEWARNQWVLQSREAWETIRDWMDEVNPRLAFSVAERYAAGKAFTDEEVGQAKAMRVSVNARMDSLLAGDTVVCLPTTVGPAPPLGMAISTRSLLQSRMSHLTCIAGLTGTPQINIPVAEVDSMPVGLSLMGARGTDEQLMGFVREIAANFGL